MGKNSRIEQERLRAKLAGKTLRVYARISLVGDRKKADDPTASQGQRLFWSDDAQFAIGHEVAVDWGMEFDEAASRRHADPDVSGYKTKWNRREGLGAHYEAARRGEFHVLAVQFADRIGRNVRETVDAIEAFLKLGVLIYVHEDDAFIGEDDKDALNKLHSQMVSAERFSIRLADRVRAAHLQRARSGLHHGGPPPSWLAYNRATGKYDVIERVAEMMRLMVDMRLQGKTECAITLALNKIGPTPKGNLWRQCNVNRYLSERFIEKMEGWSHFCVKGEDPIRVPEAFPRILSPEKAAEIKRVLASVGKRTYYEAHFANKAAGRTRAIGASTRYLLTGRIFCAVCGKRVGTSNGARDGERDRYMCYTALGTRVGHAGVQKSFRRREVEDAVLLALSFWLKAPPPPMPAVQATPIENGARQVGRINEQIDALLDLHLAGTLSKDDHLRKHQELVERRDEIQRKMAETGRPSAIAAAQEIAAKPMDRVRLRELVHLLVERVELPVFKEGHTWGVRRHLRPHVRVVLRYPMVDGAKSLLSPICYDRFEGPRRVLAE